jgi:hypothetical protein
MTLGGLSSQKNDKLPNVTRAMNSESALTLPIYSASNVFSGLARRLLRILLFLMLYFDSRAWFGKNNFVEVPGAQEAFLALLVLFFLVVVLPKVVLKFKIEASGAFVLSIIGFVLLASSLGARIAYGQPILAGMIEERRVLSYLVFFPVAYAVRSKLVSARTVLNYVTGSALLCVINAFIYYILLSSVISAQSLTSEADARADRTPLGTGFVLIALCYVLSRYVERPKVHWALLWLVFVFDVVVLEQGRQTMIAVVLVSLLLLWRDAKAAKGLALTSICTMVAILPFIWAAVLRIWQKYVFLFVLLATEGNTRDQSVQAVLTSNILLPHGALWAQWHDGFVNYFGPNFFLSDIGLFGELFRYGVIFLAILLLYYYGYIYNLIRHSEWNTVTRSCAAFIIILLILHIFQPVIEHGGFDVGVILALIATGSHRSSARIPTVAQSRPAVIL